MIEEIPYSLVKNQDQPSPSPGEAMLLENLAQTNAVPPLEKTAADEKTPSPAKQSKEGKSLTSGKKKATAAPSTLKRPRSEPSNTKSSRDEEEEEGVVGEDQEVDVRDDTMKELSLQESSSDGVMATMRQRRQRKTVVMQAKDDVKVHEIVVPNTIDFALLDKIRIGEHVK